MTGWTCLCEPKDETAGRENKTSLTHSLSTKIITASQLSLFSGDMIIEIDFACSWGLQKETSVQLRNSVNTGPFWFLFKKSKCVSVFA